MLPMNYLDVAHDGGDASSTHTRTFRTMRSLSQVRIALNRFLRHRLRTADVHHIAVLRIVLADGLGHVLVLSYNGK